MADVVSSLDLSKVPEANQNAAAWKQEPNYVGNAARHDFFKMFKTNGKQEFARRDREPSPRQSYFEAAARLGISPEPGKILRKAGATGDRINLRDYGMGDNRVVAMLPALQLMGYQSIDLSGNRLGEAGTEALVKSLPDTCFEMDLSRNALDANAVSHLSRFALSDPRLEICQLNLASNMLRDEVGTVYQRNPCRYISTYLLPIYVYCSIHFLCCSS